MSMHTAKVLQINACSLKTIDDTKHKMVQFKALVHLKAASIVMVCETWLNDGIKNKDILDPKEFTIHRKDRADKKGGGVLVAIRNFIPSKQRKDLELDCEDHNEIVIVELTDTNGEKKIWLPCTNHQTIQTSCLPTTSKPACLTFGMLDLRTC